MVASICQEMMKMFKGKNIDQSNDASTLKPHACTYFYGCKPYKIYSFHVSLNILSKDLQLDIRVDWIVDTGASDHMSPYLHSFQSIRILKKPIRIKLPDGTSKWPHKDKFAPRSIKSVLIGYPPGQKDCVSSESPLSTQQWPMEDVVEDEDSAPCSAPNIPCNHVIPKTPSEHVVPTTSSDHDMPNTTSDDSSTSIPHNIPSTRRHKAISSKWVFKLKYLPDRTVDRYKARLVIRVAKAVTVRVLIAIANAKGWPLHQLDINNAFIHGFVDEEIYMKQPEGYTKASQGQVFKLNKSLYGLKQASRQWNQELSEFLYVLDLLKDAGLTASKPTHFPLPQNMKLSLDKCDLISDPESYRRLVGRLLYLSMTRPDISYVVQHLSQFVSSPKEPHLPDATHLLRYLEGSINNGLFYHVQSNLRVTGFSDADWASCLMTRKSSHTCSIANYIVCDNKVAQQIAANPCYHERTKHLDIDSHFTRDKGQEGFLQTAYIPTYLQLADIMTKALGGTQHSFLADKLGFQDVPT
ncbi:probable carboxylesterase 2 [Tanacetum coccineum]|uniref:Probable carboxylesterase 2 n=1 Tax=Tanacetum coccineum TaxID=301880 RepID=A0ABQ5H900_9ASTR